MKKPPLRIAITGHIDHGKSTLLGRLMLATGSLPDDKLKELKKIAAEFGEETELAYLADQLKEEREQRITIETTEIYLKTKTRDYILIDTPGHLEFIKNMLTGTSRADAALLMVDAEMGVQEQTARHAFLIKLLSIRQLLVVVNKMDKVGYQQKNYEALCKKISAVLKNLNLEPLRMIPISAKQGENIRSRSRRMPWFKGPFLLKALEMLEAAADASAKPLRFPVQDVYTIGKETVAVGKISSGTLKQGLRVRILPSGKSCTIREIKIFERKKIRALPGESIGVILAAPVEIQRGDVICALDEPVTLPAGFVGNIFWLAPQPLQKGEQVTVRCATQEIRCTVENIEKRINPVDMHVLEENASFLQTHEAGLIRFRPARPAVVARFEDIPDLGRYVIERDESLHGAGTVTDHF